MVELKGVVDGSFVAKDFYVEPPSKEATAEEWGTWLRQDAKQRRAHKIAYNKANKQREAPEEYQEIRTVKSNGRWTQGTLCGFSGSAEDNAVAVEAAVDARQEHHFVLRDMEQNRHKRGGSKVGKSAKRRAKQRVKG